MDDFGRAVFSHLSVQSPFTNCSCCPAAVAAWVLVVALQRGDGVAVLVVALVVMVSLCWSWRLW